MTGVDWLRTACRCCGIGLPYRGGRPREICDRCRLIEAAARSRAAYYADRQKTYAGQRARRARVLLRAQTQLLVAHAGTTLIPLRGADGSVRAHALVDAVDHDGLKAHRWMLGSDGYAMRFETIAGTRRNVGMHRAILGLTYGDGLEGDHENGIRLDNRRSNLRIVTDAQNKQNITQTKGSRSGYRNVYWHPASRRWRVQLRVGGRYISGGYFDRVEDAVAVARTLRRQHMPFATELAA